MYTTKTKCEDFLGITISLTDAKFDDFISAAQSYIDQYTERNFEADTEASERSYNGNGSYVLPIDDCVEVTEVSLGSNFWGDSYSIIDTSGTDRYYTLPYNNEADGVPINAILLRSRYWIRGTGNHKIKAKWGWSANVPDDIAWAATFLTASIYKQGGNIGGITSERIGEYNVSFADTEELKDFNKVKSILDGYKKYYL